MSRTDNSFFEQHIDPDDNFYNALIPDSDSYCNELTIDNYNSSNVQNFNFSVLNLNIRSFQNNNNRLNFISMLDSFKNTFDIIVLSETWNNSSNHDLCSIDRYFSAHTFRAGATARGGGISVFCRNSYKLHKIDELCICNDTIETCVVRVDFQRKSLYIVGIYRPHSDSVENFAGALGSILDGPVLKNKTILVAGDMNVDLAMIESRHTQCYIEMMHSLGFLPFISKPTRYSQNGDRSTATILDHIWLNLVTPFFSGIVFHEISDHYPVFAHFNFHISNQVPSAQRKISYRPVDESKI